MDAILIETKDKAEAKFWMELARKIGAKARALDEEEIEDAGLGYLMKKSMSGNNVSRNEVLKALKKK